MFSLIKKIYNDAQTRREMKKKGMLQSTRPGTRKSALWNALDSSRTVASLMLLIVLAVSAAVLVMPDRQQLNTRLVEKQTSPVSIYAAFNFTHEDAVRTKEVRDAVAAQVPAYYRIDDAKTDRILSDLSAFISEVKKRGMLESKGATYTVTGDSKPAILAKKLDRDSFDCMLQLAENQSGKIAKLFGNELANGIISPADKGSSSWSKQIRVIDSLNRIRDVVTLKELLLPQDSAHNLVEIALEYYSHPAKEEIRKSLEVVAAAILADGNLVYDMQFTENKKSEEAAKVKPVMTEILKGQPIIEAGHELDRQDLALLKSYEDEAKKRNLNIEVWRKITESIAICLVLMLFTGIYIYHIHPEVVKSSRAVWVIGTITIIALILNRFCMGAFAYLSEHLSIPPDLIYLSLPLSFAAIVISVIYGLRSALYVGLYISSIAALALDNSFVVVITGLLVSGISGFAVRYSLNFRSYFMKAFISCTLTTLIVGVIFLWKDKEAAGMMEWTLILPPIMGLMTAVFSQIALFVFEAVFDISTTMSLLLYSDYNHPLLKRLQFEAPGTYHHSLMVSNIAEQAAQEIGANPIKARVCALFHDVGKLARPEYYTENDTGDDKHKELNPNVSSLVIRDHVKEGMELARKYKLKKVIRDAIEQHHGTELIYYFYRRAQEDNDGELVEEQGYRYPGPLPRDREIVIVSLADCCEAASRSLQKPTHGKIEDLVSEILRKKIRDGQLDNAEITFRDLAKIQKSFVKTLTSMLHGRVAYPKEEEKDEDDLFMASHPEKS